MFASNLLYSSYKACIYSSQAIYSPVSTYQNHLGFARSLEGLARGAKQTAHFLHERDLLPRIQQACHVLGAPEELITTSKSVLTWFELCTRITLLPRIGEGSWQKGTALLFQIGQKALETFAILPMKWKFIKESKNLEGLKFTKEIFSGIASVFGCWAAHREIRVLENKIRKWENPVRGSRLGQKLLNKRAEIETIRTTPDASQCIIAHFRLEQEKCLERVEEADSKLQKFFLTLIALLHRIKAAAHTYQFAHANVAPERGRLALLDRLKKEEATLSEKYSIKQKCTNPEVREELRKRLADFQKEKIRIKIHNLKARQGNAICARDFNIAKLLLFPGVFLDYAGIKNPWLQGVNFAAGLLVTYCGFRRTFHYMNHSIRHVPPLLIADLV